MNYPFSLLLASSKYSEGFYILFCHVVLVLGNVPSLAVAFHGSGSGVYQAGRTSWHRGHQEILAEGAQYELQDADQKGAPHVPSVTPVLSASTILY